MKKAVLSIAILVIIAACGPQERISSETFKKVNESMEVKRLVESEIINEAMIWGDSISKEAQQSLITSLQDAIALNGVPGAIDFCNIQALPILSDLSQKYGVQVRRASNRYRNPSDQPTDEEKPILEAYEFNAENGNKSDPNIQKVENGEVFLYTKPIVIPGGMCLSCHGDPKSEINEATLQKLSQLYPEDKAKGHKVGDLRGMWSIRIPKSEVVKRL
ncbi:Tll0287-like domain-containing protein [Algoriphagus litoralis]|uniref:Tll0287-like domain-containing protein n=1 Tax=Algoriphagus litoralis TaxID=2202829 RepID=UPI000DB9E2F5|nr:DUF3365 domain-containing protein [Algoriphagus litoralis]